MSYCRWSSDDFSCDLYVYADTSGGFTIHVAGYRVLGEVPKIDWRYLNGDDEPGAIDRFVQSQHAQMDYLQTAKREPIELPHAGETFSEPDAMACAERVQRLLDLGYRAPDGVVKALREEAGE